MLYENLMFFNEISKHREKEEEEEEEIDINSNENENESKENQNVIIEDPKEEELQIDIYSNENENESKENQNVIIEGPKEEELQIDKIFEYKDNHPFDFIYHGCGYINSNSSISNTKKILISIKAKLKEDDTFWPKNTKENEIQIKTDSIKNILIKFMNHENEVIYTNAALSYFIIGSIEFQNNDWPSFISDIFNIIFDFINNPEQEIEPIFLASLYILQNIIESKLLNDSYSYFDICIRRLWEIFNYILSPHKNQEKETDKNQEKETNKNEEEENENEEQMTNVNEDFGSDGEKEFLSFLARKKCLLLLKASIPLLYKFIKVPEIFLELVDLLLGSDQSFVSDLYDILILLFKNYSMFLQKESIQKIFNFAFADLDSDESLRITLALKFWINISSIDIKRKTEQSGLLPYYTFNVFKRIFSIFEESYYYCDYLEDQKLHSNLAKCIINFVKAEPNSVIPFISDFFSNNINKDKSDWHHFMSLKIILPVIKLIQYDVVLPYLMQILECAENKSQGEGHYQLIILSLKVTKKIVKYFYNKLYLDDVSSIINTCENHLQYPETFKIISKLIDVFSISINKNEGFADFKGDPEKARNLFNQTVQLVLRESSQNISLSYPAIISLINNTQDQELLMQLFIEMLRRFQSSDSIKSENNENDEVKENNESDNENKEMKSNENRFADFQVNSDLCQILKCCIVNLQEQEADIESYINSLSKTIISSFRHNFDEDLLDLAISIIPLFDYVVDGFPEKLMDIITELFFGTNNDRRIITASEFISDFITSRPYEFNYQYFSKIGIFKFYESILKDEAILKSVHGPIISSISDIINTYEKDDRESFLEIRNSFIPIIKKFTNNPFPLAKSENENEYANELFTALCRFYTAITNSIIYDDDDLEFVLEIAHSILNLFKHIDQLELYKSNQDILRFIVCIVKNLNQLKKSKNRISFLLQNELVIRFLKEAQKIQQLGRW